nr:MAG TPA: hypothetical protein [Caudoviricetes sp.]
MRSVIIFPLCLMSGYLFLSFYSKWHWRKRVMGRNDQA